jgi:hypothetical protein
MKSLRRASAALWVAGLLCLPGCTSDPNRPRKLSGVVTLDGKPVENAIVTFNPIGTGRTANGKTGPDGTFHLTTRSDGDGVIPGHYKATVILVPPGSRDEDAIARMNPSEAMGKAMANMGKTMEAQKKFQEKSPVPSAYSEVGETPLEYDVPVPGGSVELALRSDIPVHKKPKPEGGQRAGIGGGPMRGGMGKAAAKAEAKKKGENQKNP